VAFDLPDDPPAPPVYRRVHLPGMRVLEVDDHALNRRILEEVLTSWTLRPTLADGAGTALEELRRAVAQGEPYSLILLDAHMPEVDGFTLAAQIKADP